MKINHNIDRIKSEILDTKSIINDISQAITSILFLKGDDIIGAREFLHKARNENVLKLRDLEISLSHQRQQG